MERWLPNPNDTAEMADWIGGVEADLECLRTGDKMLKRDFVEWFSQLEARMKALSDDMALIKKVLVAKWGEDV